jgi:uncharacterized heparinase superfamily protein
MAAARVAVARDVLLHELDTQVFPDGASREQSFGYHRFVTELFELAAIVDRKRGAGFPHAAIDRIARMREFAHAMGAGGPAPRYGDDDDGHVLGDGLHVWDRTAPHPDVLASQAFTDAGHYLLQAGAAGERVSVHVRCGPFGLGRLAAHAHADELSVTLRLFGDEVLVDPGTYDYFRDAEWRRYFRSTAAHNTVSVDGCDQADMAGAFLWDRHPSARLCTWDPSCAGGTAVAQHLGYTRLDDPVVHTRAVELDAVQRRLTVVDCLEARGAHDYSLAFHVAPRCRVRRAERPRELVIATPHAMVAVTLDPVLDVDVVRGQVDPIAGWASRAYHRKCPIDTIVGRVSTIGGAVVRTTFEWRDRHPAPR